MGKSTADYDDDDDDGGDDDDDDDEVWIKIFYKQSSGKSIQNDFLRSID